MKVLIFGASGLLGNALTREWTGDKVVGLSSRNVDIRDVQRVIQVVEEVKPEWIVLTAAYTDVDGCEQNQELAFSVNRDGAVNVANAAKNVRACLLFLSSDYVFDGNKTSPYEIEDARNPQSVYGRSKAEAELRLAELMSESCIVRTSWLFGLGGKCFPDTIIKLAATRSAIDVVNDQRGCPTYTVDLARAIVQLCRKNAHGTIHVTNRGDCSWFEFAEQIVKSAGLGTPVLPVSSKQMARPAPRPPYSVLSPLSAQRLGIQMPAWQDALQRYLRERSS